MKRTTTPNKQTKKSTQTKKDKVSTRPLSIDALELMDNMQKFYYQQIDKAIRWGWYGEHSNEEEYIYNPPKEGQETWKARQDLLASRGNWRGFTFPELMDGNSDVPPEIKKKFVEDYFQHKKQELAKAEQIARDMGMSWVILP